MRRILLLTISIIFSVQVLSQISSTGDKIETNPPLDKRTTLENIKEYLSSSSSLDPIEGLYDAKWVNKAAYTRGAPRKSENSYCIAVVKGQDGFYVYAPYNDEFGWQRWLLIQRIGNTPLYNFVYLNKTSIGEGYMLTSKERVLLEDNMYWEYTHDYTKSEFAPFDHDDVVYTKYVREISAIKFFPSQNSNNSTASQTYGTGFALNKGYLATNYHVVENAKTIKVKGILGNFNAGYNASIVTVDKVNDLAILKITDNQFKGFGVIPYKIKTEMSEVGENVFVLGYPLIATMGDEIKLTTGVISAKTGFKGDVALYQISAPVQPGNSGGPLFDNLGNLIGVVNSKHTETENVSYAIKASYLLNLIESASLKEVVPRVNSLSTLNLANKVKKIKNSIFIIVCTN